MWDDATTSAALEQLAHRLAGSGAFRTPEERVELLIAALGYVNADDVVRGFGDSARRCEFALIIDHKPVVLIACHDPPRRPVELSEIVARAPVRIAVSTDGHRYLCYGVDDRVIRSVPFADVTLRGADGATAGLLAVLSRGALSR